MIRSSRRPDRSMIRKLGGGGSVESSRSASQRVSKSAGLVRRGGLAGLEAAAGQRARRFCLISFVGGAEVSAGGVGSVGVGAGVDGFLVVGDGLLAFAIQVAALACGEQGADF